MDTHQPRTSVRWGFRRVEGPSECMDDSYSEESLYIYKLAFKKELCKGFNHRRACELLKERKVLECHQGRGYCYTARLPGSGTKKEDVYLIRMSALRELFIIKP